MGGVRLLTEEEVGHLLPMSVALEAVEQVFCWRATGQTVNKPRQPVDSKEQAQIECGDLVEPVKQGVILWEDVREPGDVIAGKAPGRPGHRAVTLFESQGLAMQDVVAGARVLERARQQAVGREIDFGGGDA